MSSAVRDLLTDLMHLGDTEGFDVDERLVSAKEVYAELMTLNVKGKAIH